MGSASVALKAEGGEPAPLSVDRGRLTLGGQPLTPGWRYEFRMLGDRIVLADARTYAIPRGRAAEVQQLIAEARLGGREAGARFPTPLTEQIPPVGEWWLRTWLEPDELLLAWLPTVTKRALYPPMLREEVVVEANWLLTTHRHALVWLSVFGDAHVAELPPVALAVAETRLRAKVQVEDDAFASTLTNAGHFRELAPLPAFPPARRRRRFAALRAKEKGPLEALLLADDPVASLYVWSLPLERPTVAWAGTTGLDEIVSAFEEDPTPLLEWWEHWQPTPETAWRVVEILHEAKRSRLAVALGEAVRERLPPQTVDWSWLDILVAAGDRPRAVATAEGWLAELPPVELQDLFAADDERIARRRRLLESLAILRGEGVPDPTTQRELARLQPLDLAIVEGVDEEVAALLRPDGLEAKADVRSPMVAPWPPATLICIQHPAGRQEGPLARLQTILAEAERPDHGALHQYCARLDPQHEASRALADACIAIGTDAVAAFISQGASPVGVRAYDGAPPFLLIGGDHLTNDSGVALSPAELRFAIGSEVAHLHFGHARITSSEVWTGAMEKGKATLELLLSVAPFIKSMKFGGVVAQIAEKLEWGAIERVVTSANRLLRSPDTSGPAPSLQQDTADLIAAHRVMQFTADRAGLLLAGDLRSALRAMLLVRPRYVAELPVIHRVGLGEAITRRGRDHALRHPDLAVRVAALIRFYLSDEGRAARRDILGSPGDEGADEGADTTL